MDRLLFFTHFWSCLLRGPSDWLGPAARKSQIRKDYEKTRRRISARLCCTLQKWKDPGATWRSGAQKGVDAKKTSGGKNSGGTEEKRQKVSHSWTLGKLQKYVYKIQKYVSKFFSTSNCLKITSYTDLSIFSC